MAVGDHARAAVTAVLIAQQEQEMGNYKVAHSILFETQQELAQHRVPAPRELHRQLLLLHSYVLTKRLEARKDHKGAARMLLRVAKNISKFPAHVVPILTSTVVECQRAGLKQSCYEYACVLMRPEYRDQIPEAFKQKIEKFVRRPSNEEEEETCSPCTHCALPIPDTLLDCPSCRNALPFCATTGRHMVRAVGRMGFGVIGLTDT
jgi:WD repeat-containing protein 19